MRVAKTFSLSLEVVLKLEKLKDQKVKISQSAIIEEALQLWFAAEDKKQQEEFLVNNPQFDI